MFMAVFWVGLCERDWSQSQKAGSKGSDLCSCINGGDELCDNIADRDKENSNDDDDVDNDDFEEEGDN